MKNKIIVDIDGTVANCKERLKYIKSNPKDWEIRGFANGNLKKEYWSYLKIWAHNRLQSLGKSDPLYQVFDDMIKGHYGGAGQ